MNYKQTIVGTHIVQTEMMARDALACGLLASDVTGCQWFADWANADGQSAVFFYHFGGLFGGFIYGEPADFRTLQEFAKSADDSANRIWTELTSA